MKIGLVRHYKVKKDYPSSLFIGYNELVKWFEDYECVDVEVIDSKDGSQSAKWEVCYSSPAERAIKTAKNIFENEPLISDKLRELNVLPLINKRFKLPFLAWGIIIRNKSLAENEITSKFKAGIASFVEKLLSEDKKEILIVSHGFVMMYLQKELKRRNFTGENFKNPENGKIYVFESPV